MPVPPVPTRFLCLKKNVIEKHCAQHLRVWQGGTFINTGILPSFSLERPPWLALNESTCDVSQRALRERSADRFLMIARENSNVLDSSSTSELTCETALDSQPVMPVTRYWHLITFFSNG